MKKKSQSHYRFIPIDVYFPPQFKQAVVETRTVGTQTSFTITPPPPPPPPAPLPQASMPSIPQASSKLPQAPPASLPPKPPLPQPEPEPPSSPAPTATDFLPLLFKNEYEILYRAHFNDNNPLLQDHQRHQLHFRVHPLWLHLELKDPERMSSVIGEDGWVGVHAPPERRFSCPTSIKTLKGFLRALDHLYQNPGTYLCMDTLTRVLCVRREEEENQYQYQGNSSLLSIELDIYRLRSES